ncbi:MAG: protein-L-isoaspartate O-methyltransferase family protein [Geminicoccaceae bacterium]
MGSTVRLQNMSSHEDARRWFAEDLRVAAPVINNDAIVEAFAAVPRERFLGPGPWHIHSRMWDVPPYRSCSDDARLLYHDVLVSIDNDRDLNNGLPSLWAYVFDHLNILPGATVLQVGAGVGYFAAILAELVSNGGSVIAYEIDPDLAERAKQNLEIYTQVEVRSGDATAPFDIPNVDAIVACAGATHVPDHWLESLAIGGHMMLPLTASNHKGFMMLLNRQTDRFKASSLGSCGFYHCVGARKETEEHALQEALDALGGKAPDLGSLHFASDTRKPTNAWYVGEGFWISYQQ